MRFVSIACATFSWRSEYSSQSRPNFSAAARRESWPQPSVSNTPPMSKKMVVIMDITSPPPSASETAVGRGLDQVQNLLLRKPHSTAQSPWRHVLPTNSPEQWYKVRHGRFP